MHSSTHPSRQKQSNFLLSPHQSIPIFTSLLKLQPSKILALFLRGSRALNLQTQKSDWDYVCIYETDQNINGKLIKLPGIDVSLFDLKSFQKLIFIQNDISYLELFYLPKICEIVNKLNQKQMFKGYLDKIQGIFSQDDGKLAISLIKHIQIAVNKIKKLRSMLKQTKCLQKCQKQSEQDRENNIKSIHIKILKSIHMKIRFMNNFLQFKNQKKIKDIKEVNNIWESFKKMYEQDYKNINDFEGIYHRCEQQACQYMKKIELNYPKIKQIKVIQQNKINEFQNGQNKYSLENRQN